MSSGIRSAAPSDLSQPARAEPAASVDELIPLRGGRTLAVRLYGERARPAAAQPLVVHFHAGAFVDGNLDSGAQVAGLLAEAGARVVSVGYPLAGQEAFPAAVEAGKAALEWACNRRGRLGAAASGMWVAGEEAGGNLAAAMSLMARDCHEPGLTGQILLSPMLDTCLATASLREAHAGVVGCRWAAGWQQYLSRPEDALHPYAAPGRVMRLNGLPPTLLVTAHDDPMRDETLAYGERLRAAGVAVAEAVLDGPTGWPGSYMNKPAPDAGRPAWADELVQHFQAFFAAAPRAQAATALRC